MELGTGDLSQLIQEMADKKTHHSTAQGDNTYTHSRDRKFVWRQIIACVKSLHMKNIVNTDLKPGNFITFGKKIKLSDLGLALNTNEPG
jgi:serine/threonine protein kinase